MIALKNLFRYCLFLCLCHYNASLIKHQSFSLTLSPSPGQSIPVKDSLDKERFYLPFPLFSSLDPSIPSVASLLPRQRKYIKIEGKIFDYLKNELKISPNILTKLRKHHQWLFNDVDYDRHFLPIVRAFQRYSFTQKHLQSIFSIIPTTFRDKTIDKVCETLDCLVEELALTSEQLTASYVTIKTTPILQLPPEDIGATFRYLKETLGMSVDDVRYLYQRKTKLWLLPRQKIRAYHTILTSEYGFSPSDIRKMLFSSDTFLFTDALLADIVERNYLYSHLAGLTQHQLMKLSLRWPQYLYLSPQRIIAVINALNLGLGMQCTVCQPQCTPFFTVFKYTTVERLVMKCRRLLFYLTNREESDIIRAENIPIFHRMENTFVSEQKAFEESYDITWLTDIIRAENIPIFHRMENTFVSEQKAFEESYDITWLTSSTTTTSTTSSSTSIAEPVAMPPPPPPPLTPLLRRVYAKPRVIATSALPPLTQYVAETASTSNHDMPASPIMTSEDSSILSFFDAYYVSRAARKTSIWQDTEYDHFLLDILQTIKVDILPSPGDLQGLECVLLPHGFTREDLYRLLWKEVETLHLPHDKAVKLMIGYNYLSYPLTSFMKRIGLLAISLGLTAAEIESIILRQPR